MVLVKSLVFTKIPAGAPIAREHLDVEQRNLDISTPPEGGLILKVLYAALEPYQRARMRDVSIPLYSPAIPLGETIDGHIIAEVHRSGSPAFGEGDIVRAHANIAEYARIEDPILANVEKLDNPDNLDLEMFLGPLGLAGTAAWTGLMQIAKPKAGEVIYISAATSGVGELVGQMAKRQGLTVIGSAGSDEKLDYMLNKLGFDAGFNYKKERPSEALARLIPGGIDIFFDHVGGDHLDAALNYMRTDGRIIACGMIQDYNTAPWDRAGVKNLINVIANRLTIRGFIIGTPGYPEYCQQHQETFQRWLAEGTLKVKFCITPGIDLAPEAFTRMLAGESFGKAVLKMT